MVQYKAFKAQFGVFVDLRILFVVRQGVAQFKRWGSLVVELMGLTV